MHSSTPLVVSLTALLHTALAVPQFTRINRVQTEHTIQGSWIARVVQDDHLDDVLSTVVAETGLQTTYNYTIGGVKGFAFDGDDTVLDILESIEAIEAIEPDFKVYASVPMPLQGGGDIAPFANDSLIAQNGSTWGLARISHREPEASSYIYDSSAGKDTFIYVIDTGIYTEHSEFGGRATLGQSFIRGSDGEDDQGHGTHCSGTAAGTTYGVAKEASLIAVKVLSADGSGRNSGVLRGVDWAVNDAKSKGRIDRTVLSMSLGGPYSRITNNAIASAVEEGAFIAVAAGNEGQDASNSSPASAPEACTVGATDKDDTRSSFSNFGSILDIFAPGRDITSAWIGSPKAVNTISGTSMATPHIAGLAAYLIGLEGPRLPAELCRRIQDLATKNVVADAGRGSPNVLAYNGNGA